METPTKESNTQSESKDDIEETLSYLSTIPESLTDDRHPEVQPATIAKEAIDSDEYESRQESRIGYSSIKTSNEDACQIESECEESKVKEVGGERETSFGQDSLMPESQHLMNINETDLNASRIDDRNYNTCPQIQIPSSDPNFQSEESSSSEIVDIPTHQSSSASISTRNTVSTPLFQSSVPLAIPSTSRDTSDLGAAESYPKRPTNFGTNEKQALHIFPPRNPTSIPIPIRRGHWVYLRDSPESSDYGGSPDSLDDPFLLEALNISTPENEMESVQPSEKENSPLGSQSSLSQIRDELLSESSRIEMRSKDAPSESCHVEGSIEDLQSESSHIQVSIEDLSSVSSHNEGCIEDLSNDSGGIEMSIEDHPCQPIQFQESTKDLPCVYGHTEMRIVDLPSESCHIKENTGYLSTESDHSCENIRDLPRESGHIEVSIEDQLSESAHFEESIRDLSAELGHNDDIIMVQSYESGHIEVSIEDKPSESGHIEVSIQDKPTESGYIEVSIEDKPSESSRNEVSIEDQPHASGHIERRIREDPASESGQHDRNIGDILSE